MTVGRVRTIIVVVVIELQGKGHCAFPLREIQFCYSGMRSKE